MKVTTLHYGRLIEIALNDRPSGVLLGPFQAAQQHKLRTYNRAGYLVDLLSENLIAVAISINGRTGTLRLTEQGKAAIIAMPSDLHVDLFPLPIDIANAKKKVAADRHD